MSRCWPDRSLCKSVRIAAALLLLCVGVGLALQPPPVQAQSGAQRQRTVEGKVTGSDDQVLPEAVVYLQNQKTLEIKTYITPADGMYRFGQLSTEADYQLWAELKGKKSKTRTISAFDSKRQFTFDLKIDTAK